MPTLIFAGQVGWLVDDLLADLAASNYLNGKIQLMPGLSTAELRQAYRSCLFSVFPSHCEGWGLPIAESLVCKFCVASTALQFRKWLASSSIISIRRTMTMPWPR